LLLFVQVRTLFNRDTLLDPMRAIRQVIRQQPTLSGQSMLW